MPDIRSCNAFHLILNNIDLLEIIGHYWYKYVCQKEIIK